MSAETMSVIEISQPGGPEVLTLGTRPRPVARQGEALIKVAAAGVNGADLVQRRGLYPVPADASDLLGLEVSGTIAALGEGVTGFAIGDRVCALVNGGGYAGYVTVPAGQVLPLPANVSFAEGAALMETLATVWTNVFEDARLRPGESILIHGGSSGIGTTAIQMARLWGATVYATAGSAEKVEACTRLGATRAINYRDEDFSAVIRELTGTGVDVILDVVGGRYLDANLKSLARRGRLAIISLQGGRTGELDLRRLMSNALQVTGSTLRPRSTAEKTQICAAVREHFWDHLASGRFRPLIDSVLPLSMAGSAHEKMERSAHIGKIVLDLQ